MLVISATCTGAGDWQELVFDLGREPQWLDQVITSIQLDLNSNSGDFEIDYIRGAGPGQTDYSAWAAGWYGAKTLVVERGPQLGGTTTTGGVAWSGLFCDRKPGLP